MILKLQWKTIFCLFQYDQFVMTSDKEKKLDKFLLQFDKKTTTKTDNVFKNFVQNRFEFTRDFKKLEQELIKEKMIDVRNKLRIYGHDLDYVKDELFINKYPSLGYKVDIKNKIGSFVMIITGDYDRNFVTVENFTQNGEFLLSSNSYKLDQLDQDVLEDEIKNGFLFFAREEIPF